MKYFTEKKILAISAISLFALTGCDPVTITLGGAALVGSTMVGNEEGVTGSISDTNLQAKVNAALLNAGEDIEGRVELCVKHGMVVVIGYMKNEDQRIIAMNAVRNVKCFHEEIFDETSVQTPPTAGETISDGSITARLKSSMKFADNVRSLNYDITTVKGVVYICGTALSEFEKNEVITRARSTSGVAKVKAFIKVKNKQKDINTPSNNSNSQNQYGKDSDDVM